MPLWLIPLSLAADPGTPAPGPLEIGPGVSDPGTIGDGRRTEIVLSWASVGFAPAVPESPAIGPDLLALGPNGLAAVYDPLGKRVIVVGGATFAVPAADDLAFTAGATLLVLNDRARTLRAYTPAGDLLGERALPGLVPPGGFLGLDGETVCSVDVFGGCHPLAVVRGDPLAVVRGDPLGAPSGPALRPAARRMEKQGDALLVDGERVVTGIGRGGGRLLGDWLIVETMDEGTVTRSAVPVSRGRAAPVVEDAIPLPVRGRLYAPARDVSVAPDGSLGWIDPRADGLHLVRVAP